MKHCLTILTILFSGWLWGQNCPIESPLLIPANDSTVYNFDVFDVLNNDLAAAGQGVCGVQMRFRHNSITDFEVWLTSPGGTTIQLIGPNATVSPATLGGSWNVTFVPCLATPMPQVPFGPRWNNSTNPFGASGITGSYWPFQGCLEEFKTGPVNGTWKLKLKTQSSTQIAGRLIGLNIQFCDKRGQRCCFADAGVLNNLNNVAACQYDNDLNLALAPTYTGVKPDSRFGYTFAIGRDMILQRYDSIPDLRRLAPGNYQVCGLSYTRKDASLFPMPNNVLRLDTLRNRLFSDTAPFCGELTTNCVNVTIAPRSDSTVLPLRVLCEGDSVVVNGQSFKRTGRYYVNFNQPGRCDSLVVVPVRVQTVLRVTLDSTICAGDSVRIGTSLYNTTGKYVDTLQSRNNCDSIVALNLQVLPAIPVRDTAIEICTGRSVLIGGQRFSTSGVYTIPLLSRQGCDSLIRLTLNVITPNAFITSPDTVLTCTRSQIVLDGTRSTPLGQVMYRWEDNMGNPISDSSHYVVNRADTYYLQVITNRSLCARRVRIIITADTIKPLVTINGQDTLDCQTPRITLRSGNNANLVNPTYTWSTSGNGRIEGAANRDSAIVSGPGIYNLKIDNGRNGCSGNANVQVIRNTSPPTAVAGGGGTITCTNTNINLTGTGSSQGTNFQYRWRGLSGQAVAVPGTIQTFVQRPGAYELAVTNTINQCVSLDTITVAVDTSPVQLLLDAPRELNCINRTVTLNPRVNPGNRTLGYNWRTVGGGNIVGSASIPNIIVDRAGSYALEVTDQANGCISNAEVMVRDSSTTVRAIIAAAPSFSCKQPEIELNGTGSLGGNSLVFRWTTANGRISGVSNRARLTILGPGTYQLLVRDTISGCSAMDSVVVNSDQVFPVARTGANQELTCSRPRITLNAQGSATGSNILYSWRGPCPISDSTATSISVNCEGEYVLKVTNTTNGCSATDTVLVNRNPLIPNARVASTSANINCTAGEAFLSARGSSGGQIRWFFQNNEVGRDTQLLVRDAGTYLLVINNSALGCADSATVVVSRDCRPIAIIAPPARLTCQQSVATLDGTGSTFNASTRYRWIGPTGQCITSDTTLRQVDVICPGTYQLIIENQAVNERDTATVVVTADQTLPVAVVGRPDTLTCAAPNVTLDGRNSTQGPNIQYSWLNNQGQVVSRTSQAQVSSPGLYALEVLNTTNGCLAQTEVLVPKDTNFPQIILNSASFPCNRDTFSYRGATVLPRERTYQFRWTGPNVVGKSDTLLVNITRGGQYVLSATDLGSNCIVTDTINIQDQINCAPCVRKTDEDLLLTCTQTELALPAAFCRPCAGCTVTWTSTDGNFVSRADTITPRINRAGTYNLTVIDSNARQVTLSVVVRSDQQVPILPAGFDANLTCGAQQIALPNPDSTTNNPITWNWTTTDGILVKEDTIPGAFRAARMGTYRLTGRNVLTRCESFTLVRIGLDTLAPRATAGADAVLDCTNQRLTLNGSRSSVGPGISYLWTALDNGRILAGENSLNPIVDAPGRYLIRVEDSRNQCSDTDTLRITPDASLPPINPIADQTLNCRDTVMTLMGSMPASGNYTGNWCALGSNRDTLACFAQPNLRVTRAGLYSYELTDTRNNCRNRIFVKVNRNNQAPVIDAGNTDTLRCDALSLRLEGDVQNTGNRFGYSWSGRNNPSIQSDTTLTPTIISGGWYRLQVQNRDNFCTSLDSVFVASDLGRPQVSAGQDTILNCVPLQISLQGSFSSPGGETLEARWTANGGRIIAGQNNAIAQVDQPGIYRLTVRNAVNNCVAVDEVQVSNQASKPEAQISGPNLISCNVTQVTLSGAASTNPFNRTLRYFWTPVDGGRIIGSPADDTMRTARAGLYRLIVTDALSGCQDSTDFALTADIDRPRIDIAPPVALSCSRSQVRIDASGSATGIIYRYSWNGPNGQTLADSSKTPLVTLPGIYQFTVRNTVSGCIAMDSAVVTEDYVAPRINMRALDVLDCATSVIELEAGTSQGRNLSFRWSAAQPGIVSNPNTALIRVNAPGLYRLLLTDGLNGCSSQDSLVVQEASSAIDTVTFAVRQPGCVSNQAGQVVVTNISGGTAPFLVLLNNALPEANNTFRNLRPGAYTLNVKDAGGCLWTSSVVLQAPTAPSVELGPDRDIKLGDSISIIPIISTDSIVSFTWSTGTILNNPNARNQVLKPSTSTTAQITIQAANGCTATDLLNIRVIRNSPLFVPNIFSPNGDGVNDLLNIFAGSQINKVNFFRIYDRWGNQVYGLQEFRPNDPLLGWDGTLGGKILNSAVFTWYAEVEMADGKLEGLKGSVTLMR